MTAAGVLLAATGFISFIFPSLSALARGLFVAASLASGVFVLAYETSLRRTLEVHGDLVVRYRRFFGPTAALIALSCLAFAIYATDAEPSASPDTADAAPGSTSPQPSPVSQQARVYVPNDDGKLTVVDASGQTSSVSVGSGAQTPSIAPPGTPKAGTVYTPLLAGDAHAFVTELRPNGDQRSIDVCQGPRRLVIAPAGTPAAGTVYVPCQLDDGRGFVTVITADDRTSSFAVGAGPSGAVIAPAGARNAGFVYVSNANDGTVSVLRPGSTRPTTIRVGGQPQTGAVAPSGTPNAGTVYVPNTNGVLTEFLPTGRRRDVGLGGSSPRTPVIAAAGSPNAGNVYIVEQLESVVEVLRANGAVSRLQVSGQNMYDPAIAPAGVTQAGTVYIPDHGYDAEGYTLITVSPGGSVGTTSVGLVPQTPVVGEAGTPMAGNVYVPCSEDGTLWILKPNGSITHLDDVGTRPGQPAIG